jgi:ribonuclease III
VKLKHTLVCIVYIMSSVLHKAATETVEDPTLTLPYNENNILIDLQDVQRIISQYNKTTDLSSIDINIYRTSMVHRSYCTRKNENFVNGNVQCPVNCMPLQEESNERLEFLGDAVINIIIGKYLFDRYPDENEGFLTKLRTKLVNGTMLAHLCELVNFQRFLIISKQIEANNGRLNKKILEDAFEAFVGAMYLDFSNRDNNSLAIVQEWIVNLIEENIDFSELISTNSNYKDVFLKYFQHTYNYVPKFFEISTDNVHNGKIYVVCIKDKHKAVISTGRGQSKKHAENDAAHNALKYYGQL